VDIFLQDPEDVPLPAEEVRLRELWAETWPDGRRVKVYLEVTPFQRQPSAEVSLLDPSGEEAAHASILETMTPRLEFNLHLRKDAPPGDYTLTVSIYYQKLPTQEQPEAALPEALIVDHGQVVLHIPK
jgi:hypothetical protein